MYPERKGRVAVMAIIWVILLAVTLIRVGAGTEVIIFMLISGALAVFAMVTYAGEHAFIAGLSDASEEELERWNLADVTAVIGLYLYVASAEIPAVLIALSGVASQSVVTGVITVILIATFAILAIHSITGKRFRR